MTTDTTSELISASTVARILGISTSTLRNWRLAGTGPRAFKVGKQIRYRLNELKAFIEEQELKAPEVGL